MSESSELIEPAKLPITKPTLWVCVRHPFHSFRVRTLRGIHENEEFLQEHDSVYRALPAEKKRDEAYRFMNLQRNILWIVRFFALAGAGVIYYLLRRYG